MFIRNSRCTTLVPPARLYICAWPVSTRSDRARATDEVALPALRDALLRRARWPFESLLLFVADDADIVYYGFRVPSKGHRLYIPPRRQIDAETVQSVENSVHK